MRRLKHDRLSMPEAFSPGGSNEEQNQQGITTTS
jgi:hypothetical protein